MKHIKFVLFIHLVFYLMDVAVSPIGWQSNKDCLHKCLYIV